MRIKKITWRMRRDFTAIYECEHCKHTSQKSGYDDMHFHEKVIPNMICDKCGKKSADDYQALDPKYPEGLQI